MEKKRRLTHKLEELQYFKTYIFLETSIIFNKNNFIALKLKRNLNQKAIDNKEKQFDEKQF